MHISLYEIRNIVPNYEKATVNEPLGSEIYMFDRGGARVFDMRRKKKNSLR